MNMSENPENKKGEDVHQEAGQEQQESTPTEETAQPQAQEEEKADPEQDNQQISQDQEAGPVSSDEPSDGREAPVSQENKEAEPTGDDKTDAESVEVPVEQPQTVEDTEVVDHGEPEDKVEEESAEDQEEDVDYSHFSKGELIHEIEKYAREDDVKKADRVANALKPHFDEIQDTERQEALQKFKETGGDEADFDYKDEAGEQFYQAYRRIKERKSHYFQKQETDRNQNLKAKEELLNRLRELVDSEETQISIDRLKDLQKAWRNIGPVPPQHNRSLWANYNALIDRFYDKRSIYFELKELDRRKNMEAKLHLCERAEALDKETDLRKALRELDELHEEYKHIGPVPKEEQEALWQRFKAASDKIHDKRREHVEHLKVELEQNMQAKLKLVDDIKRFTEFNSDSIREWNQKTREIQEIQKKWESIGSMPREHARDVNKQFWSQFKQFFANKGEFFKKLDEQREENLKKKEELVSQAEALKDSNDWQQTANKLKKLQKDWKEIGPVPEKQREPVFQRFKAACDAFFERKREANKEVEAAYQKNLEAKEAICEQIENMARAGENDAEKIHKLSEEYANIGFVPRNAIKKIARRYEQALDAYMEAAADLGEQEKEDMKLEMEVTALKGSPRSERKLDHRESSLRRKISRLEEDISLWKNNISFFANSRQADKLKAEYEQKIEEAGAELAHLKSQLDMIENLR
jgi:hypothetical protein